jgi:hypothetical protein
MMKQFTIAGHKIEFNPETHQYIVDGFFVESISKLVDYHYPRNTKKIDPEILRIAAEKGNELHDMIEQYERFKTKTYHPEMQGYIALKNQHQIDVIDNEKIVLLHHHGVIIAAGTFDMIIQSPYIKGLGIADVKRMAHLDEARIKLQLNLYKLAYEQTYKQRIDYLKCFHIRKRYRAYIDVPVDSDFTKHILDEYIKNNPIDYTKFMT